MIAKKRKMTQTEYVKAKGQNCPYCHSANLSYDYGARRPVFCDDCKKSWADFFKLAGYES